MKGVSLFEKHAYEQILFFWELIPSKWTAKFEIYDFGLFSVLDFV